MESLFIELYMTSEDDKTKQRNLTLQELPFYKTGLKSEYFYFL